MKAFCVNRSLNCCAIKLLRQLLVHSSQDLSPSLILSFSSSLSLPLCYLSPSAIITFVASSCSFLLRLRLSLDIRIVWSVLPGCQPGEMYIN